MSSSSSPILPNRRRRPAFKVRFMALCPLSAPSSPYTERRNRITEIVYCALCKPARSPAYLLYSTNAGDKKARRTIFCVCVCVSGAAFPLRRGKEMFLHYDRSSILSRWPDPEKSKVILLCALWIGGGGPLMRKEVFLLLLHSPSHLHPRKRKSSFEEVAWCACKIPQILIPLHGTSSLLAGITQKSSLVQVEHLGKKRWEILLPSLAGLRTSKLGHPA